jgi:CRP/FNR family cyclic AMP-dependent transcriptional regulator
MASKKASLEHLRHVSLFASCSTKDLQKIAKVGDEITMAAGTMIVDQGQTGREGTGSVKRNGKTVATLGAGTMVGELSLLDHGPRTATVTCESDCTLMLITQRHFSAVLDEIPALAHKLLASLAGRIRELDRQYYG